MSQIHEFVQTRRHGFSRRRFLHTVSAAAAASGMLGFSDMMSAHAAELRKRQKAMILLWMQGGPSQFETFDPKPGTDNGGPTEAISTSVSGIQIADNFPKMAQMADDIAFIRSMTNKEGSHPRATYQMHTGYIPSGSVKHPSLGSAICQQIGDIESDIPSFVSIGNTQGAGFLGMDYEPFVVARPGQLPENVAMQTDQRRMARRLNLLGEFEQQFAKAGAQAQVETHKSLYGKSARLMASPKLKAFDISEESDVLRSQYGDSNFGRGCLLARRLIEEGVTFVEVRSGSWDTHDNNFERSATNAGEVDPATAALLADLRDRGMLDSTLVVWMGEFGRTPRINAREGRDHYPRVFNGALAGCGVQGGQVIGASTADGSAVDRDPVTVPDLFRSVCRALGVDADHENLSPLGRPIRIADGGQLIPGLIG